MYYVTKLLEENEAITSKAVETCNTPKKFEVIISKIVIPRLFKSHF